MLGHHLTNPKEVGYDAPRELGIHRAGVTAAKVFTLIGFLVLSMIARTVWDSFFLLFNQPEALGAPNIASLVLVTMLAGGIFVALPATMRRD